MGRGEVRGGGVECVAADDASEWGRIARLCPVPTPSLPSPHPHTQASDDRTISRDEWDAKLAAARVPGGALDALVMDFLVTEVRRERGRRKRHTLRLGWSPHPRVLCRREAGGGSLGEERALSASPPHPPPPPTTQGYVDAARAFSEETGTPTHADLASLAGRTAVRRALAAGDVDGAVASLNDIDASILEERPSLAFALQQQRLIELARAGDAEGALAYAREHVAPRGDDDARVLAGAERALALLAFPDPSTSPLADLLSPAQRAKTAGEANAAILEAEGRAGGARLPLLVALAAWAQDRLAARGVRFPRMADPVSGVLEGP